MQALNTRRALSLSFFFLILFLKIISQQNPVNALKKLYDDYPQEKIYLWFNKSAYIAGESIWFKAYVFSGYDLSYISSTLYVELYDAEKKLLSTKLLPIIYGVSEGSIDIENKLSEGVYFIRAYTEWMLNFDERFQFVKQLLIYNPSSVKKLTLNKSIWNIAAIPEGGSLISGIETKIAVRRYINTTLNTKWSGYLYEESSPTVKIKEFNSLDENVALFSFTPEARKRYHVYVTDEYGNNKICSLPLVKSIGVKLSIEENGDSITYRLRFQDVSGNGNGYQVIGNIQQQLVYYANFKRTGPDLTMKIPANQLNNGILQLIVLDPSLIIVAERLVFVNQTKLNYDSSVIVQHALSAESRGQNKLLLKVDSMNWLSYAITVEDAGSSLPEQSENILSALWLSSDLINPIQNAGKFFEHPDKNKVGTLDAIMISEKWMRFDWTDIINNKYPLIRYLPKRYLSFTGKVAKGNKLKSNEAVNLILYYPDSSNQFIQSLSDSTGNIVIDNILFMNDARIYYQLNTKKYAGKLIDINFESNNRFVAYSLPLPQSNYILSLPGGGEKQPTWIQRADNTINMEKDIEGKYKTLQEVVIRSKLKTATEELNEKLSSGLFNSMNEVVFDFVNQEQNALGHYNILQWLEGRVAGLNIQLQDGQYVPYIRGSQASLYIDEMQADASLVGSINISDVALIKVIKGPFALMTGSGGGTIAIYTARGNLRPAQREPSLPNNKIKGYDTVTKFFSPYYDIKSIPQPESDKRDQLLWQTNLSPTVSIDKTRVIFFNNDSSRRYRVMIQGFTESGFPVYLQTIIEPAQQNF